MSRRTLPDCAFARGAKQMLLFAMIMMTACMAPTVVAGELDQLAWLAGCWTREDAEHGSIEQWMPLAGGTMLGMGRTVRNGKTIEFEFMRIGSNTVGGIAFFAQPSAQPAAVFPLLSISDSEVIFENLQHDFPQRVIYRFERPDKLHASIEGVSKGARRQLAFPMLRTSCDVTSKSGR